MPRYCIFCGKSPEEKTREHIIPEWLIRRTGRWGREISLGLDLVKSYEEGKPIFRSFSFSEFVFPSCNTCNQLFSELEGKISIIFERMFANDPIDVSEFSLLLDWFDKVRVGLWLAEHQLNKDFFKITPNFFISQRKGSADRILIIEKSTDGGKGISFLGTTTPAFAHIPSVFSFIVNDFFFFNMSFQYLLSRRIGFPYPDILHFVPNDFRLYTNIQPGHSRIMRPLLRKKFRINGTELYQPMFHQEINTDDLKQYYDLEYVRKNSLNWDDGEGTIFIKCDDQYMDYRCADNSLWMPTPRITSSELHKKFALEAINWQIHLITDGPSFDLLSKEEQQNRKHLMHSCVDINLKLLNVISRT